MHWKNISSAQEDVQCIGGGGGGETKVHSGISRLVSGDIISAIGVLQNNTDISQCTGNICPMH